MHRKKCTKHQHWVPQFYLRYFATPESRDTKHPKVWIFSKESKDENDSLTSIRNVCGKNYLYSPQQLDGDRSWALEDKLNDVETLLGPIWSDLATNFVALEDEQIRQSLALFVSITHMRHPDMRNTVENLHGKLINFYETTPVYPDGTPMIESIEFRNRSYKFDTTDWHTYRSHGRDGHDRTFAELVQSETGMMAKHLMTKRWSMLFSSSNVFVTSDKPVALSHMTRERYGYGTMDTIITFPISPSRVLVMDDLHSEPANQYHRIIESNIGAVNMAIWQGARRFLITGRPIPEVLSELIAFTDNKNDA
ncbi:DUF4238 domain-containing protein [candidate division WWE3 bacterium]|uniref:DUF4238 domain-containing protein n=1 Tax=candidate division WWE3 bacterium TaxID=2053526 RepID=A0A928TYA4_UNCKA|nr:DUF4238 domain-containing protein [candidate division WWE3 bacterium]